MVAMEFHVEVKGSCVTTTDDDRYDQELKNTRVRVRVFDIFRYLFAI